MRPQLPSRFSESLARFGAVIMAIGAVAIFAFVIVGYVERDVLRMRGIVLSVILVGAAAIVWSESRHYVPPQSGHRTR